MAYHLGARRALLGQNWTPKDLGGNLKLWLDASDANTITITGAGVSIWADKSGNGNNATQTTDADRPSVDAAVQNGRDAIRFDAANTELMVLPDLSAFTAVSIVALAKCVADLPSSSGGPIIELGTDGSAPSAHPFTDGLFYDGFGTNTRKINGVDAGIDHSLWWLFSARSAPNDWEGFVNGKSLHYTTTNTVGIRAAPRIGQDIVSSALHFDGHIAEIIITNHAMSQQDRQSAEIYLAKKWNTLHALPNYYPVL